jgi:predicted DNA-binding transcriptional regulator AlpA
MRIDEVAAVLDVTRQCIYNWMRKNPDFPQPLRLAKRSLRYDRADVMKFLESLRV